MERYFIDYLDGANDQIDAGGAAYTSDEAAFAAARTLLAERVSTEIIRGGDAVFSARVRCGSEIIFHVSLALTEEFFRRKP
jgi:hypothetical protein